MRPQPDVLGLRAAGSETLNLVNIGLGCFVEGQTCVNSSRAESLSRAHLRPQKWLRVWMLGLLTAVRQSSFICLLHG